MTSIDRSLADIAHGQRGVITRAAANAAGVTDAQLRSRVQSGTLVQTGHHTYRPYGRPDTPIGQLRELLADLGGTAVASGPTAAALHGFDGHVLRAPFDVTVWRGRNLVRLGHRIHTTTELDPIDRATVQGCATLSPVRTLIDLARHLEPEPLRIALDCALRDGLISEDLLHRRIATLRRSGRYGIPALLEVMEGREIVAGAHSWLEREFLRLASSAGLPRPDTQQVLGRAGDRLVRVDFRFPGTPVVVEVLGYRYHRTASQMRRDSERQNALLADGFLPYQFTYSDVVERPHHVTYTVAHALTTRQRAS